MFNLLRVCSMNIQYVVVENTTIVCFHVSFLYGFFEVETAFS